MRCESFGVAAAEADDDEEEEDEEAALVGLVGLAGMAALLNGGAAARTAQHGLCRSTAPRNVRWPQASTSTAIHT